MFHISELQELDEPHCPACGGIYSLAPKWSDEYAFGFWIVSCLKCDASCSCSIEELPRCLRGDDDDDDDDDEKSKNSPGVEVNRVQEPPIESKFGRIVYPKLAVKPIAQNEEARPQIDRTQSADVHNRRSHPAKSDRDSSDAKTKALGNKEGDRVLAVARDCETDQGRVLPDQSIKLVNQAQEPIAQLTETSPGVEDDFSPECSECFDDKFIENQWGPIIPCPCCSEPKLSRESVQSAIAPAAKNLPGSRSKISTAHQLLELFKTSARIIEESPGVNKAEATVSESAIAPAAVTSQIESDLNPILTGVLLSDKFLARYSPPQAENIRFQSEADGQLSLLDFEVESQPEPPDPDDFVSIEEFQEALARWDAENAEMIAVSMDSMCEWAPCPEEWYESGAENLPLKAPSMIDFSPSAIESSSTFNFSIPTFDILCDRLDRRDEPPDTGGILARLPKPKPPNFPPPAASQLQVSRKLDTSWTQLGHTKSGQVRLSQAKSAAKAIPKLFRRVTAGSSTQPARSPPGGDAMQ
jgi:hypothetical protein